MKKIALKLMFILFLISTTALANLKVLSLTLGGDEILIGLGMEKSMVGVCGNIVDNKKYSNIVGKTKGYKRVENNLEEILYLNPDLVIVADWMNKDQIQHLENAGINLLKYKTPKSFSDVMDIIETFEKKLNIETKGDEILKDLNIRIEEVEEKAFKIKKRKKVLLYSRYGTTSGENTIFDDISKISNFDNVAKENGIKGSSKISKEKIVEFNPEIIIVPSYSLTDKEPFVDKLLSDESLQSVTAVKNKEVYEVKGKYLMTSSHHMINALEIIFKKVYPEE